MNVLALTTEESQNLKKYVQAKRPIYDIIGVMEVIATAIPDVKIVAPEFMRYARYFAETYTKKGTSRLVFCAKFVQDNESCSSRGFCAGSLAAGEHGQAKLVRVIRGPSGCCG